MPGRANLGEFVIPFAQATSKLRKARDAGEGVELDADEVNAVVQALRNLARQP